MKKYTFLITLLLLIITLNVSVYAIDSDLKTDRAVLDENLASQLINQLGKSDSDIIKNKELYSANAKNVDVENKPIIKVYNSIYWEVSDQSINNIILRADLAVAIDYIVLGNEDVRLTKLKIDDDVTMGISNIDADCNFIEDIKSMSINTDILGDRCRIKNIVCFDAFSSYDGASVYVITDKGIFIKYYSDPLSEGMWFSEDEYSRYAIAYHKYLTSPENNYNENGEPLYGKSDSFLSYIENHYDKSVNMIENEQKTLKSSKESILIDEFILWFIPFFMITSFGIVFIVIKKNIKKH